MTPILTRWLIRRDLPTVLAIERESFQFPWREDDFVRCLRQRNIIGCVAELDNRVAGFVVYERLHNSSIKILNLAVAGDMRRRGVGRALVELLRRKLSPERRRQISLEIRETNLPGQLFFSRLGFRAVAVLRDQYADSPGEDAYLMRHRVATPRGVMATPQARSASA